MELERLTKSQTVLLTLLVSFVTSIATGIVTVTLLDQAPPAITQTINRVVERTVERVVPDSQGASVITKEVVTVVKEDDLITDSIAKNAKSLARVYRRPPAESEEKLNTFVGLGTIVSAEGIIATDATIVSGDASFLVTLADGGAWSVEVLPAGNDVSTALLKIVKEKGKESTTFPAVGFGDATALKLGQSVISLSGQNRINVFIGIVSGLAEREVLPVGTSTQSVAGEGKTVISGIEASFSPADVTVGSPLVNIFGELVGVSTIPQRGSAGGTRYTPASVVLSELSALASPAPAASR